MSTHAPRNDNGLTEDDLWAQLDGQIGVARSTTLVDLAGFSLERGDAESALPLIDAAVDAAVQADNELMQARSRTTRGLVLFELRRYAESARDHLAAARMFERYESADPTCLAYFNASWSFEAAGEQDAALESAEAALATAVAADDAEMVGRCHVQCADVLRTLDRPHAQVLRELAAARAAFRGAGAADEVIGVDLRRADVLLASRAYDEAVDILTACRDVAETQDAVRHAFVTFRLGRALRMAGRLAEALSAHQAALDHAVIGQEFAKAAFVLDELAMVQWGLGNHDEAFDLLARSRAHHDAVGRDDLVNEADSQRAGWLHAQGRYQEAIELNERLLSQGTRWKQFMTYARMADNQLAAGRPELALVHCTPRPDEDPDWVGTRGWFWRESVRAQALQALQREAEAQRIAQACLAMPEIDAADPGSHAVFCELHGEALSAAGHDEASRGQWMSAVALYLAAGDQGSAERLASVFLPVPAGLE